MPLYGDTGFDPVYIVSQIVMLQTLQYLAYGLIIGASHLLLGTPMSLDTVFSIESNMFGMEALVVAIFVIPATGSVPAQRNQSHTVVCTCRHVILCCRFLRVCFQGNIPDFCGGAVEEVCGLYHHVLYHPRAAVHALQPGSCTATAAKNFTRSTHYNKPAVYTGNSQWLWILAHHRNFRVLHERWRYVMACSCCYSHRSNKSRLLLAAHAARLSFGTTQENSFACDWRRRTFLCRTFSPLFK